MEERTVCESRDLLPLLRLTTLGELAKALQEIVDDAPADAKVDYEGASSWDSGYFNVYWYRPETPEEAAAYEARIAAVRAKLEPARKAQAVREERAQYAEYLRLKEIYEKSA